ncbi:MAG: sulfatase [Deltaproteobacteria bacterium]|nr:sulfatase [Deltaproteobacteria bacterium]
MRILYIDIDTLRPDHLGCYGYHRETSPTIDKIAQQGVRFDNVYCSDAPCLPSRTALMSGLFGIHSGVVGHGGSAAEMRPEGASRSFKSRLEVESLAGVLSSNGYRTASISPFATRHGAWSFYAGFGEIIDTGRSGMESAEEVVPKAAKWLEDNAAYQDWFLYLNLWDPHAPYRVPAEFGNPFLNAPIPAWLSQELLEIHRAMVGPHKARNVAGFKNEADAFSAALPEQLVRTPTEIADMADLKQLFDGYDIGVRYADAHVRHILELLEQKKVLGQTAIIISSDHGENLGELGIYAEHGTADCATCRIPLIIRWPGKARAISDSGFHYNLDLAPTLIELLGLKGPPIWDGRSFAPAVENGCECGRDYLVLSQCAHVCQRSVRFDDWLYIRSYHDGFHLFPKQMLFDLRFDPHEQTDLAEAEPEICRQAVYRLCEWHDEMMASMTSDVDPLWTVIKEGGPFHARGALKPYCEFLEKTGRAEAADELRKKHPREWGRAINPNDYARQAYLKNLFRGLDRKKT